MSRALDSGWHRGLPTMITKSIRAATESSAPKDCPGLQAAIKAFEKLELTGDGATGANIVRVAD